MLEKRLYAVPPQAFTANGDTAGIGAITIGVDACTLFKVKQQVLVAATGLPTLTLQIKEIDPNGTIWVGPFGAAARPAGPNLPSKPPVSESLASRTSVAAYTTLLSANISADIQGRQKIDNAESTRAVYEEEPAVAIRSILVDDCGDKYNSTNPLPVAIEGSITIGDVSIVEGGNTMTVNPDGSINVDISKTIGLFTLPYDSILATYPSATVEDYQSYLGGLSGTPVQLVVVTYTDSTKNFITSVVRTPAGP